MVLAKEVRVKGKVVGVYRKIKKYIIYRDAKTNKATVFIDMRQMRDTLEKKHGGNLLKRYGSRALKNIKKRTSTTKKRKKRK